jgi:hypothetical protein
MPSLSNLVPLTQPSAARSLLFFVMYETNILLIHLVILAPLSFNYNWAPHLQKLGKKCLGIKKKGNLLGAQILLAHFALCEIFRGSLALSVK